MAIRHATAIHFLLPLRGSQRTGDDVIGVSRMDNVITIAVKNDGKGKRLLVFENVRSLPDGEAPFRMAANAEIRSSAAPQARPECTAIAAYRSVGCPHYGGRSGSG